MTIKDFFEKYGDIEITEEQEKQIKEYLNINKRWKPSIEDTYFFIDTIGNFYSSTFNNDYIDIFRLETGNCFKNKKEAEFRLEQIKVYNELKNFADENNDKEIDWNNKNQDKFIIYYNHHEKSLDISCRMSVNYIGQIYFSSNKLAQQAVEKVGVDRIKKYLFGVE